MKNIQPITALRNTSELEKDLQEIKGPLFITKNGYSDLVILAPEYYEALLNHGNEEKPKIPPYEKEEQGISSPQSDPMGLVKVGAFPVTVEVCGVTHNEEEIKKAVLKAENAGVKVVVLPELCLSGYTCGDMFFSVTLHQGVEKAIKEIEKWSQGHQVFFVFGAPLSLNNSYFNCAIAVYDGKILGVVPKSHLPNYGEFYERRHFQEAPPENGLIVIGGESYPFGTKFLFVDENYLKLKIAIEICEDLWVADTPSTHAALAGASLILNLSASNETVGKKEYRENLVAMTSARLYCAYAYADAGEGESTTDLVFSSHNIVAENGKILAESHLFQMEEAISEVDLERVLSERRKTTTFGNKAQGYKSIYFSMPLETPALTRHYPMNPFIPEKKEIDLDLVKLILSMQAQGLITRLKAVHEKQVFFGLSGGLDSTLALLVSVEAFKKMGYPLSDVHAITLPAFGTSERTHHNASLLAKELGVGFEEINIKESLLSHFKDIGHDPTLKNVTYENAQARTRTLVLMDVANERGGLMVGTGDLSELCLGWTTYGGDHMSMYGVNASIPKTLVRYLVEGYAKLCPAAEDALLDIVDTPISPELLPTDKAGAIAQKTEDKIGPYELNDFFIYHFLRFGYRPAKLYYLASYAYAGKYSGATIKKWLRNFFSRFFGSEFKRSCLPDGAKVGTVAISPRGDLRMPSDASCNDFLKEVDAIEPVK